MTILLALFVVAGFLVALVGLAAIATAVYDHHRDATIRDIVAEVRDHLYALPHVFVVVAEHRGKRDYLFDVTLIRSHASTERLVHNAVGDLARHTPDASIDLRVTVLPADEKREAA